MTTTRTFVPRQRKARDEPTPTVEIHGLAWMREAACRGVETDIFFTEEYEIPSDDAKRLCHRCPVKAECLQYALDHDEDGYWGGMTKTQREAIQSGRNRIKCPGCGGRDFVELRETICLGCGLSW